MAWSVYKHTSPNGKVYIGITGQKPNERFGHDGSGYFRQKYFYSAIRKHGWNNFKHEILFKNLTKAEAEQKEIELIAIYKSDIHDFGYNLDHGGNTIGKHSEESKRKMSEKLKGRVFSEESRRKMSASQKGLQSGRKHPLYGKGHSEESKKKMSESTKGMYLGVKNPRCRKIVCIETGEIFDFIKEAAEKYGRTETSLVAALRGRQKSSAGYHWEYLNEEGVKRNG